MNRRAFVKLAALIGVSAPALARAVAEPPERRSDVVAFKKRFAEQLSYRHRVECQNCQIISYNAWVSFGRRLEGARQAYEYAGVAVPCARHDREAQYHYWIADVPDADVAYALDQKGAFCLDVLRCKLDPAHAEYDTGTDAYTRSFWGLA